jgi:two-component system phosphate regulon sensor histidine kinase PhoR
LKKSISAKKLSLILITVILLPALFFTANEFNSLNSSEKMLAEVYSRQLETILYSVNQYAWDVANGWVRKIDIIQEKSPNDLKRNLIDFLSKNQAVRAVFFSDSLVNQVKVVSLEKKFVLGVDDQIQKDLEPQLPLIKKLNRFKRTGYRKIEPIFIEDKLPEQRKIALIFIPDEFSNRVQIVGMLLDNANFIQNIILPKLQEMAGNEFILAVLPENETDSVFTTELTPLDQIKQKKQIWIFPNYYLGIRLKGQTVEELARSRFYRNLFLILILDFILLIVIWFVYRNILKEIDLARMKSDFVSNVSHELKTPLSLIRMFAETLEMNRVASEEKKQEYYRVISHETERLSHLVNNILNFSRMEAGRKEYHFQTIELNSLVKKVLENYDYHLRQNGFEVKMKLADKLPLVKADEESQKIMGLESIML